MLGDLRQRGAGLALGLVCVGDGEEAAEVRVAAEVARDEDQLVAVDLERAADDGLDAELAAGLEVFDRSIDAAAVRDGEGRHLQLGGTHPQLVGMRAAVEEREVGVGVELDIWRHRFSAVAIGLGTFCTKSAFRGNSKGAF